MVHEVCEHCDSCGKFVEAAELKIVPIVLELPTEWKMAGKELAGQEDRENVSGCFEPGACDCYAFWTALAGQRQNPKLSWKIVVGLPCFGAARGLGQHLWVRVNSRDYDWLEFLELKNGATSLKEVVYFEWKLLSPDEADPRKPEFVAGRNWSQSCRDWAKMRHLLSAEISRYR